MFLFGWLYAFFMGAWRDAFGKNGYDLPIIKYRAVQHIILFIVSLVFLLICRGTALPVALWISAWILVFWALGHGCCYDIGTGGKPDAKMLKRYEKMVGYKLLCKIFPEDQWYSWIFDFCLLAIRYTYPLLPIFFWFNPVLLTLGLVISGAYGIYRNCKYLQTKRWLDVEIWVGFVAGVYIAFL